MSKKKILIVDDDDDLLFTLGRTVASGGYDVVKAYTGREAIDKAKEVVPDLILMDLMLPDLDGGQVTKILDETPETKGIPLMFLTGMVGTNDTVSESSGIVVGEKRYAAVGKPYDREQLLERIKQTMEVKE